MKWYSQGKLDFLVFFAALLSLFIFAGIKVHCKDNSISLFKSPSRDKIAQKDADTIKTLSEQLGQNLIVGIPDKILDMKTEEILHYIKPAGIVLYSRNYMSYDQIKELINRLQKNAHKDSRLPYFIMIDEEPGGASRLGLFKDVFILGLPNWKKIELGIIILKETGINVLLAPIADFPFNNLSFIRRRIPIEDVEDLISFNQSFTDLLYTYEISATLKHFPGMGIFIEDPHKIIPNSNFNQNDLNTSLQIFQNGIRNGVDFIMTSHAIYEDIDSKHPATYSSILVENILKSQLGFGGIVITDDISDMAFSADNKLDIVDVAIQSIKAGHHLLIFSHKLKKTIKIFDKIILRAGTDDQLKICIKNNYDKVTNFKKHKFFK